MNTPLIEACVDSYASCRAAYRGGADRLELCAHLVIGGTTPSTALFRQVQRDIPHITLHSRVDSAHLYAPRCALILSSRITARTCAANSSP